MSITRGSQKAAFNTEIIFRSVKTNPLDPETTGSKKENAGGKTLTCNVMHPPEAVSGRERELRSVE